MADGHGQQSVGQAKPVVEISAQRIGLRGPTGHVPLVQKRGDGRQLVPLHPLGRGDLFLDRGRGEAFLPEHFPIQVGGQASGNHFDDVRLPVVEIAAGIGKHPQRAQDRRGRGDGHTDGGGEIFRRPPWRIIAMSSRTTACPSIDSRSATAPCKGRGGAVSRSKGSPQQDRNLSLLVASSRR